MSQSPPPASDITQGTVQDVLYYDSRQVKRVGVDGVPPTVVKINKTKQNPVHRGQVLLVTSVLVQINFSSCFVADYGLHHFFTIKWRMFIIMTLCYIHSIALLLIICFIIKFVQILATPWAGNLITQQIKHWIWPLCKMWSMSSEPHAFTLTLDKRLDF